MRAHVVVALSCGAIGACLFPALDGLSGGDGGDASNDAIGDFVSNDSPLPTPTTTWCSDASARFCEDFDTPDAAPFAQWPSLNQKSGATFALDVSDASPPYAVRFSQVAVGLDGGSPFAAIERDFTSPAITKSAHLGFDARIDEFPAFGDVKPIVTLQLDVSLWPNIDDCVALAVQAGSAKLFECVPTDAGSSTYPGHTLSATLPLAKWSHVDIDILAAPNDIIVTVAFDGSTVLPPTKLDTRVIYGVPALQVGDVATDPRASMSFLIDDITFDWQ